MAVSGAEGLRVRENECLIQAWVFKKGKNNRGGDERNKKTSIDKDDIRKVLLGGHKRHLRFPVGIIYYEKPANNFYLHQQQE